MHIRWLRIGGVPLSASTRFVSSEETKAALIMKHEGFARSVAVKTAENLPIEIEDAIQLGMEGLCKAAQRFDLDRHDPSLGDIDTNFKSFAYPRIRGAVIDHVRGDGFIKRRGIEKGMTASFVSLDAPFRLKDSGQDLYVEIEAITGDQDLVLDFGDAMTTLSEREQYVVLALATGKKGRELAAELGVSESRISQINTDAKRKLSNYIMEVAA